MATPMKRNEYFIVPDKTVCVACSKESKQRYFVRTKQGCAGPSLKLVNKFYGACFDRVENDGAFLCIGCKRLTERILEMVSKSEELTTSLTSTSQKFKLMHVPKRTRVETPGYFEKHSRRKTPQLKSPYSMKSFSGASSSKSKRRLDFSQSDVKDVLDTTVQCELVGVQRVSEKKEVHQYYSISQKRNLQPAVRCLTSGSIRKGMRLLLTNADATVKEKVVAGVTDVIRQECRMLQKDVFQTSKDSLEFSMNETTDSIKTMPITWSVLNTVGDNKNKVSDTKKVTTAACLLLNSRSMFMSKLQHNVAVTLYNNHLQKEGFEVLHKLGIPL